MIIPAKCLDLSITQRPRQTVANFAVEISPLSTATDPKTFSKKVQHQLFHQRHSWLKVGSNDTLTIYAKKQESLDIHLPPQSPTTSALKRTGWCTNETLGLNSLAKVQSTLHFHSHLPKTHETNRKDHARKARDRFDARSTRLNTHHTYPHRLRWISSA